MASADVDTPSLASLKQLIDARSKTSTRRLTRQLEDLDLGITSVASQAKSQVEKALGSEDMMAVLLHSGYYTLTKPREAKPAREVREARVSGPAWADEADEGSEGHEDYEGY